MSATFHVLERATTEVLARRAAGWLAARGLSAGDRVAVLGSNHPKLLALTHGALRTGIIPVIVNPSSDVDWILRDSRPALVVRDLDEVEWDHAPVAELAPYPLGRPMMYTSGTTGWAKGVTSGVLSEAHARAWAEDEADLWEPDPSATWLVCSPLYHSAGHRSATTALLAGERVLLMERFDAEAIVRLVDDKRVSGMFLVPTHLKRLLELDPPKASAVRRVLHAGEKCPEPLKRRALEWFPRLWEFYGSTEGQFSAISPDEWLERPGSVGRARRDRTLSIHEPDENGVGTVYVQTPEFARWEYFDDPERTASAWRGDSFTVGDLGRLDDDGYLFLVSRREDLVISGGVNVYPAEVERILHDHPLIRDVAVFGVDDPDWGQRVCAAVVADGAPDIGAWLRERVSGARMPKQIFFVEALPRTATGKVDRAKLRGLAQAL